MAVLLLAGAKTIQLTEKIKTNMEMAQTVGDTDIEDQESKLDF